MVAFYSNENFPIDMVEILRELGHDVLTSYEAGQANQSISDESVLAYATQKSRVVITLNREDFIQLHRSKKPHKGIVICKDDRDYIGQVAVLHEYIQAQAQLHNRLIRVQKQNQAKSSQQIFVVREYQ